MKLNDLNKKLIELEIAFPGFPVQQVNLLECLIISPLYQSFYLFRLWQSSREILTMMTDSATKYLHLLACYISFTSLL